MHSAFRACPTPILLPIVVFCLLINHKCALRVAGIKPFRVSFPILFKAEWLHLVHCYLKSRFDKLKKQMVFCWGNGSAPLTTPFDFIWANVLIFNWGGALLLYTGFCWSVAKLLSAASMNLLVQTYLPNHTLFLRPACPWAQGWVQIHLLLTQPGCWMWKLRRSEISNDICAALCAWCKIGLLVFGVTSWQNDLLCSAIFKDKLIWLWVSVHCAYVKNIEEWAVINHTNGNTGATFRPSFLKGVHNLALAYTHKKWCS